jgi:threonine/homoserine/homoserine lactone efflux protein
MTALLSAMAQWFEWLRWIGVAYLVYLGVKAWRAPPLDVINAEPRPCSAQSAYLQGFLVSLTNPKTLLFFGAFLPQFINPSAELTSQLLLLSATFLVIALLLDGTWALTADRFRRLVAINGKLHSRLTGGLLVSAGLGPPSRANLNFGNSRRPLLLIPWIDDGNLARLEIGNVAGNHAGIAARGDRDDHAIDNRR